MEPLSEAELDQLAERLGRIQNENALSLEGVDGLFCALIASPVHVPPSAYLPVVLGGELGNGEFFRDFAPEDWDALFESEEEGDLFVIPLVVGEVDAEWPKEPLTTELQDDVVTALAVGFARSYRHFADARRENADAVYDDDLEGEDLDDEYYPDTYVRPAPNVGRNDPCPCGSGKKYKKCCGVADDLAH